MLAERTEKEVRLSPVNRSKKIALEIMSQERVFKQTLILRLYV